MARPNKIGLDYFPLDVDIFEDEKISAISGEFGIKGEITVIKLLCAIYRNGYFILWNDLLKFKLLRNLPGISSELIESIVNRLVLWEFFDKALFDSVKVLTSKGIQRRYFEASKRRKTEGELPYLLINVCNNRFYNDINASKNTIKERKEKESNNTFSNEKDITISSSGEEECDSLPESPPSPPAEPASEKIPLQEIADMWNAICPNLSKVERITDKRKRKIPVRVKEMGGWEKARPLLEEIFRKVQRSNFLNGDNDRGWTCSFDWIFENGTHWVNIHEGRYDNTRPRPIERRSSIDVSALTQRQTNFYNFLLRNGEFLLNMPVFPTDEEIGNLNSIPKPELTEIVKEINNKTYLLNGRTSIYETILEIKNKRNGS